MWLFYSELKKKGKNVIYQRIYVVRIVRCKRSVERRHSLAKSGAWILHSLSCFIHHWTSSSSVAKPIYSTQIAQYRTIILGCTKKTKREMCAQCNSSDTLASICLSRMLEWRFKKITGKNHLFIFFSTKFLRTRLKPSLFLLRNSPTLA